MVGPDFFLGMLAGFILHKLLTSWRAMWRVCCREHYETHATCPCRDCAADRVAGVKG